MCGDDCGSLLASSRLFTYPIVQATCGGKGASARETAQERNARKNAPAAHKKGNVLQSCANLAELGTASTCFVRVITFNHRAAKLLQVFIFTALRRLNHGI